MTDTLEIFGDEFTNVTGIKATDDNNQIKTYIRPQGTKSITQNGTGIDVTNYANVDVSVSGGGGTTLKMGVIRPDAELAESWSYDKLAVQDEGYVIPAYITSQQTVRAQGTLASATLEYNNYDYFLTMRGLAYPIYSTNTVGAGRFAYFLTTSSSECVEIPANTIKVNNTAYNKQFRYFAASQYFNKAVYWTSESGINIYSDTSIYTSSSNSLYGTSMSTINYSVSGDTLTLKSPAFYLRGYGTYFNQTYWDFMTDIRYQYIIELWKTPKNSLNIEGYQIKSQILNVLDCVNNGGTLT